MFIVLNVIGAVLIIRYSSAAYSGLKFRSISNAAVIVIGALKFAVFLRNASK